MDAFDETLDFVFERSRQSHATMLTLAAVPYDWSWTGGSPGNFGNQIDAVDVQLVKLGEAEADTTLAAVTWDNDLAGLIADAIVGTRSAPTKFKGQPARLKLFDDLRYRGAGRDARYKQALDFEISWAKADPAWIFKNGLALAQFKTRREAIRDLEVAHVTASKNEQHERALLHSMANDLNDVCVEWYSVATAQFGEDTVAGQLVRTVPTTYDPSRAPGQLRFTVHISTAPNQMQLVWRAARGERSFIRAQRPGAAGFDLFLDGITGTEWVGLGVAPGLWRFDGYATNQFGQGPTSEIVEVNVAAVAAA